MSHQVTSKIRAVYEALEMHKNKQALKLIAPLLEKKPANCQLRILKAMALLRLAKKDEALKIAREVKALPEVAADENLLNNLAVVFREGGCSSEATECFLGALERQPNSIDLTLCVFQSYGRDRAFLKQQQFAQKMHKQFGDDRYQLWAIACTTLQVLDGGSEKLLVLAERQLKRREDEGKLGGYEELLLYLWILERQGKYEEALRVVDGPDGAKLYTSTVERLQTKASFLCRLGRWEDGKSVYEELLGIDEGQVRGREEWTHIKGVIDCLLVLNGFPERPNNEAQGGSIGGGGDGGKAVAKGAEAVAERGERGSWRGVMEGGEALVKWLKEREGGGAGEGEERRGRQYQGVRARVLASLELYGRLLLVSGEEGEEELGGLLVAQAVEYVKLLGDRDVCSHDLVTPLKRIPRRFWPVLLAKLKEADANATCLGRMERLLGAHQQLADAPAGALEEARRQVGRLVEAKDKIVRKEGYPPDRTPSDDNAILAARILLDLYARDGREERLVDAAVICRFGLQVSPTNFQFKLLLLRIYRSLGAVGAMLESYTALDIKHILCDTLSYLLVPAAWAGACLLRVRQNAENLLRLDRDNHKDTAEYTYQAFRHGTYSKLSELYSLQKRLLSSLQLAAARTDWVTLSLTDQSASLAETKALLKTMCGVPIFTGEVMPGLVNRKCAAGAEAAPAKDERKCFCIVGEKAGEPLRDNRDMSVEVTWDPLTAPSRSSWEAAPERQGRLQLQVRVCAAGIGALAGMLGVEAEGMQTADLASSVAHLQDCMTELGWIAAAAEPGAPYAVEVLVQRAGERPAPEHYWDGMQSESHLAVLSWRCVLLLCHSALAVNAAVDSVGQVAVADAQAAAATLAALAALLRDALAAFNAEVQRLWGVADAASTPAALSGFGFAQGVEGVTQWGVRPLTWAPLLLQHWAGAVGELTLGKKADKGLTEAIGSVKTSLRAVKTAFSESTATTMKTIKAVESVLAPTLDFAVPSCLEPLDGHMDVGAERSLVAELMREGRVTQLKSLRGILQRSSEAAGS